MKKIKTVILCGGIGYRLREETEFKPKPMVEVGGKPILWHIMKIYSHFGFNDFVIALGYKGNIIKDYFINNKYYDGDFTLNTKTHKIIHHPKETEKNGVGKEFEKRAKIKQLINGGFMVFKKKAFDFIKKDSMIEDVFDTLINQRQLSLFEHRGFFHAMDTYQDMQDLNNLWREKPAWKIWA